MIWIFTGLYILHAVLCSRAVERRLWGSAALQAFSALAALAGAMALYIWRVA